MKKWVCPVCGYVYEGENPPAEFCPVCHVRGDKFTVQAEEKTWAAEHVVGVGKVFGEDVPAESVRRSSPACVPTSRASAPRWVCTWPWPVWLTVRAIPRSACTGRRPPMEEAEHAAKFAELLGEVVTDSTKKNLQMRVDAENGATAGKFELAKQAKELQPGRHPRHRPRDGPRRSPPWQGFRGPAEEILQQVILQGISEGKRKNPLPLFSFLLNT